MQSAKPAENPCFGFVSIIEATTGHIGGYLVLSTQARPLEFHCTAPVQPSRAHEILYGTALRSYLYGEQIASTLVSKSKQSPLLLLTDIVEVAQAPTKHPTPILYVSSEDSTSNGVLSKSSMESFRLDHMPVAIAGSQSPNEGAITQIKEIWNQHGQVVDLLEPFDRIREALAEAQGAGNSKPSTKAA